MRKYDASPTGSETSQPARLAIADNNRQQQQPINGTIRSGARLHE